MVICYSALVGFGRDGKRPAVRTEFEWLLGRWDDPLLGSSEGGMTPFWVPSEGGMTPFWVPGFPRKVG